jgi:hypothetical protein
MPTQAPQVLASPSPPASLQAAFSDVTLIADEGNDLPRVIGVMQNLSSHAVTDVLLHIWLYDASGHVIAEQEIPLALQRVESGMMCPFEATFEEVEVPISAGVEVRAYRLAAADAQEVEVQDLVVATDAVGKRIILGRLVNHSSQPVALEGLALLIRGQTGQALQVAMPSAIPEIIAPQAWSPFAATIDGPAGTIEVIPFVDATTLPASPSSPIALSGSLSLEADSQGNPFVVGRIHNAAEEPRWASFLVGLLAGDELLSVVAVQPPLPILADETRPFALADFPALAFRMASLGAQFKDLHAEVWINPMPSQAKAPDIPRLAVQISRYEPVGASLFISGQVMNQYEVEISSPSVFVAVYHTNGSLLTAGWLGVGEVLAPGETEPFQLAIRMPARSHPSTLEFDIWAAGLAP